MRTFLLLFFAMGCSSSSALVGDAGTDLPPDLAPSLPEPCAPHAHLGCSDSIAQWYWNGEDCELQTDCRGTGFATLYECRSAFSACGAPDRCEGTPPIADACAVVRYAWSGTHCAPTCQNALGAFPSEHACSFFHEACGARNRCGEVLGVGCQTIDPRADAFQEIAERCPGDPGGRFHAQAVFVAPAPGTYRARFELDNGAPAGAALALSPGACSDNPRGGASFECLGEEDSATFTVQPDFIDSTSARAVTLRIRPFAFPDEYARLRVCIEAVE